MPRYVPGVPRYLSGLAAAAALSTVTVAVAPLAAAAPAAASAPTAAAAAGPVAARARSLTLINGQQISLRPGPGGRLSVAALAPADDEFSALERLTFCGQVAEIPAVAMPFFGRGLDPSLFLVRSLLRAEHGGRLPVRLAWAGSRRPALPGVTITRAGAGTAAGYLTAAGGRAFGAALARQAAADHGRASYGTDGLFAHGLSVRLAGSRVLPRTPRRPRFVQHTLTVRATDLAGRPDNGDTVLVFNADNCNRFGDPFESSNVFRNGVTKFSVPAGHYWAFGDFLSFDSFPLVDRIPILPQFTVNGNTTVSLDERSATSEVGFTTPRPSVAQNLSFSVLRTGADHSVSGVQFSAFNARILVSPVSVPPTVGGLLSFTTGQLNSPKGAAGPPYVYDVDYPAPPGLVGPQHGRGGRGRPLRRVHADPAARPRDRVRLRRPRPVLVHAVRRVHQPDRPVRRRRADRGLRKPGRGLADYRGLEPVPAAHRAQPGAHHRYPGPAGRSGGGTDRQRSRPPAGAVQRQPARAYRQRPVPRRADQPVWPLHPLR